jgi:hypothetical protein
MVAQKITKREQKKEMNTMNAMFEKISEGHMLTNVLPLFAFSRTNFYAKIEKYNLKNEYKVAKSNIKRIATKIIYDNLTWDNWRLALKILEVRDPKRWWNKQPKPSKGFANMFDEIRVTWINKEDANFTKFYIWPEQTNQA